MTRTLLIINLLCVFNTFVIAQKQHAIKVGVTTVTAQNLQIAYEVRVNEKSSLELSFGFQKHNDQPEWLFNGSQANYYILRKVDTSDLYGRPYLTTGWYEHETKSLDAVPEYFPLQTYSAQIGWRFNYQKRRSKWRLFVQPSLYVARLDFFSITNQRDLLSDKTEVFSVDNYPYNQTIKRYSLAFSEKRIMYQKKGWLTGISYSMGLVRRFGKHFFLEGRVQGGALLSAEPYQSPKPPLKSRAFWIQPVLLAGWGF